MAYYSQETSERMARELRDAEARIAELKADVARKAEALEACFRNARVITLRADGIYRYNLKSPSGGLTAVVYDEPKIVAIPIADARALIRKALKGEPK